MKINPIFIIIKIFIVIVLYFSIYTIDEREQVIITQFGRVVGEPKKDSGLYFKIPFIQKVNYFPKNLQQWDSDPGQIPTLDKTYIWVDSFARWRITDPVKFFQTVNNKTMAINRLDDIIDPAIRNFITSYHLIEAIRRSNRKLDTVEIGLEDIQKDNSSVYNINFGREAIVKGIIKQAHPKLAKFGIELVDVKIKRINYVEQVRDSVYSRMIAERKQIAEKFRSEGKGEANKILGDKDKDLKRIISEAYRTSQEIKGKADAEATKIFAEAFGVDPEFYSFTKTLEIYESVFNEKSTMILSTDSEFLKYLKAYSK